MTRIAAFCGTHGQPFERLVHGVDGLAREGAEVWVQYGDATPPVVASGAPFVSRDEVRKRMLVADVVVCHGGPGLIWEALGAARPVVVFPRSKVFKEHVDDHQVAFTRRLHGDGTVIAVYDVDDLQAAIGEALRRGPAPAPERRGDEAVERITAAVRALYAQGTSGR